MSADQAGSDGDQWPLAWVEQTVTVDAIGDPAKAAIEGNPGWRLLHVGMGSGGQTTLTYGWPWGGADCGCYTVCERPESCVKASQIASKAAPG